MLLAGLESEHEGALVTIIFGHADDTTWHFTDEFLCATHIAHVRTTELHRYTKTLTIANGDISPPFSWGLQYSEVGSNTIDYQEGFLLMTGISKACKVFHDTIDIRLLNDDTGITAFSKTGLHIV